MTGRLGERWFRRALFSLSLVVTVICAGWVTWIAATLLGTFVNWSGVQALLTMLEHVVPRGWRTEAIFTTITLAALKCTLQALWLAAYHNDVSTKRWWCVSAFIPVTRRLVFSRNRDRLDLALGRTVAWRFLIDGPMDVAFVTLGVCVSLEAADPRLDADVGEVLSCLVVLLLAAPSGILDLVELRRTASHRATVDDLAPFD